MDVSADETYLCAVLITYILFACVCLQGTQIELSIGVILGISTMAGRRSCLSLLIYSLNYT